MALTAKRLGCLQIELSVRKSRPNTGVLPVIFYSQEFRSSIYSYKVHGHCDNLEVLKVDKSRFGVPYVASVTDPRN
jgi:hypothetical protein